jgi:hypothetical protein
MATKIRLPRSPEEISAAWLEQSLQDHIPGARIHSARLDDTWQGTATKYRVAIEANDVARAAGLPDSLVVKGRFQPDLQIIEEVYAAEVMFYRDLQPRLGIHTPRAFHAESDHEAGQHLVVLEDLNCRNVHFCRVVDPISHAQTAAFLDNMAKYHAIFWNSPELEPGGAFGHLFFWDAISPGPEGAHGRKQLENFDFYTQLPRGIGLPRRFRDRDRMAAAIAKLNEFGRQGDMTLLHGDHHLGNLYIDAEGNPGVLDWQSPAKGHWSHDLTYFLISAMDIEDRKRGDKALIAYYLSRLAYYGVANPPSFEAAMEAFRIQIFDGLFYWLVNPVEWQVELNNCAVVPRFAQAALDYDSFGLIDGLI